MKLLYCPNCGDLFALANETRTCRCGRVHGHYTGRRSARYGGPGAVALVLDDAAVDRLGQPGARLPLIHAPETSETFRREDT